MAFNYAALKTEITTDPLGRGYATMTNVEVAASLNAVDRPGPVPAKDVVKALQIAGKWAEIERVANGLGTAAPDATIKAALTITSAVRTFEDFDLSDATVAATVNAALDALVAVTLISSADKAIVLALQNNRQSRAQELGLWAVTAADVKSARGMV